MKISKLVLILGLAFSTLANSTVAAEKATLRLALSEIRISFDPLAADTLDSMRVHELIYQRLLSYDPNSAELRLQTQLALTLPVARNAGLAFDVEIGESHFVPARASALLKRTVSAQDVRYSFERVLRECDAKNPQCALLRSTIKSVELRGQAKLRFHLRKPNFDFPYMLAMPITAIVAPEGIANAEFFGSHQFHLSAQVPSESLTLERTLGELKRDALGAPIQVIRFQVLEDKSAQLQMFLRGELDFIDQLGTLERSFLQGGVLGAELSQAGARLSFAPEPEIIYYYLSPTDGTVGGSTPARIALRRAILQSYSVADEILRIREGLGQVNTSILPGEFPEQKKPATAAFAFDPQTANAALDQHGFARGADGWRRWPDGNALALNYTSEALAVVEPYREARRAQLASLGIRMNSVLDSYANNLQRAQACKAPFWGAAWSATIPTPGYVLSVLRSERIGSDNLTCYRNPEFDRLHEQAQRTPAGPKRAALYQQLIALIQRDAIWQMGVRRQRASLFGPRVSGLRTHPMLYAPWDSLRLVDSQPRESEEFTYLKAMPGQQAALAEFIRRNWFAMDAIAKQRGLIAEFDLLERAPSVTVSDWDLLVRVRYPHAGGYAAIESEFEGIRNAHQSVLIEGKTMRELGNVVRSEMLLRSAATNLF